MFRKIKNIISDIRDIRQKVNALILLQQGENKTDNQKMIDIYRTYLGVINIDDIHEEEMSTTERKEYVSHISGSFKEFLEPLLKKAINKQVDIMVHHPGGINDFEIGTLNGIEFIFQKLEKLHNEHMGNVIDVRGLNQGKEEIVIQFTEPKVVNDNNQSAS
jgi:hypothetical protein